mmetsp:Transcript_21766/g.54964  ORF Transcript_21766/g.54964 Transcript_21766/m.54964 type:complete len:223 (+) Transcript_21766:972-1640(+)
MCSASFFLTSSPSWSASANALTSALMPSSSSAICRYRVGTSTHSLLSRPVAASPGLPVLSSTHVNFVSDSPTGSELQAYCLSNVTCKSKHATERTLAKRRHEHSNTFSWAHSAIGSKVKRRPPITSPPRSNHINTLVAHLLGRQDVILNCATREHETHLQLFHLDFDHTQIQQSRRDGPSELVPARHARHLDWRLLILENGSKHSLRNSYCDSELIKRRVGR